MSSVSESLAKKIAANNGVYVADNGEKDPQAFAVFKIRNSNFGHEHHVVAYTVDSFISYASHHEVTEVLWARDSELIEAAIKEFKESML